MKFNDFEKAALIGAAVAGVVAGEQSKAEKPDSTIEKSATEQAILAHHQRTEVQKEADGREYLLINGIKAYLSPERVDMKVTAPIIESSNVVFLGGREYSITKDSDTKVVSPKIESTGGVVLQSDKDNEDTRLAGIE